MTAREAAALRDQAARSRLEYEEWKRNRRTALKLAEQPASPDAFLLAGDIAEYVTALELQAADMDDAEFSRAVAGLRGQVVRVGNVLARRRRVYGNGASA